MGGRLAMQYAARSPEKIASLFLISAHRGLSSLEAKKEKLASDIRWAKRLLQLPIDEFLKQWYDQPLFRTFKPDFSVRRIQNKRALAASLIHYSLGKQELLHPTNSFSVVGEFDEKFRALYPDAAIIEGASHAVHLENPKDVARILHDQLETVRHLHRY
jgi:2-succinyl-6-hydroxy-2,4-cyclohexadiene-1-carboxylate synthase